MAVTADVIVGKDDEELASAKSFAEQKDLWVATLHSNYWN